MDVVFARRAGIDPRLLRRLLYPMVGGHPTDHSNRQPGACKNSELMSTALILATESRGCEPTGDTPGEPVLMKSELLQKLLTLRIQEFRRNFALLVADLGVYRATGSPTETSFRVSPGE
jgi:hypothetical protein